MGDGKIPMGRVEEASITVPIGQYDANMSDIPDSAIDESDDDIHSQERGTPARGAATQRPSMIQIMSIKGILLADSRMGRSTTRAISGA